MDFVSRLPLTPTEKNSVWVIVDRLTKFTHFILVQTNYSLQKLVKLYISKIAKLRDIEYFVGDFIFLKVFPWKKVMRFDRKGKLSPRFIGPYQILKRVGLIAYQLKLPSKLDRIHDVFYISILRRYWSGPSHVAFVEEIEIRLGLTFEDEPIQILVRDIQVLMRKSILLVKVLWQNHGTNEAAWEPEDSMH
ncbi:uncharacterized protein LOC105786873 [Gossypium raimondii]|uniref:uncharacterized protein LOC105786873 n=1 Tax=Gossypium raimondii TaxID=29730 RepID=UPI00063AFC3D|nr:uncharacterized protein LOC105786873 [Gossypium raimondii]